MVRSLLFRFVPMPHSTRGSTAPMVAVLSVRTTGLAELARELRQGAPAAHWLPHEPSARPRDRADRNHGRWDYRRAFGGDRLAHVVSASLGRLPVVSPYAAQVDSVLMVIGISLRGIVVGEVVSAADRYAASCAPHPPRHRARPVTEPDWGRPLRSSSRSARAGAQGWGWGSRCPPRGPPAWGRSRPSALRPHPPLRQPHPARGRRL